MNNGEIPAINRLDESSVEQRVIEVSRGFEWPSSLLLQCNYYYYFFLIAEFQRAWMFSVCAREGNLLFFGSLALGGVPVANNLERLPILCA